MALLRFHWLFMATTWAKNCWFFSIISLTVGSWTETKLDFMQRMESPWGWNPHLPPSLTQNCIEGTENVNTKWLPVPVEYQWWFIRKLYNPILIILERKKVNSIQPSVSDLIWIMGKNTEQFISISLSAKKLHFVIFDSIKW